MYQYAIYACDALYGGLHGINYQSVIEASSMNEALEFAKTAAYELISSYSFLEEELEDEVSEHITQDMTDEDIADLRADIYANDIEYYASRVQATGFKTEYLDSLIYEIGYSEFCDRYC